MNLAALLWLSLAADLADITDKKCSDAVDLELGYQTLSSFFLIRDIRVIVGGSSANKDAPLT